MYISQDPIGLAGNNPNFYADVFDSNIQVDVFGLEALPLPETDKAYLLWRDNPSHYKVIVTNPENATKGILYHLKLVGNKIDISVNSIDKKIKGAFDDYKVIDIKSSEISNQNINNVISKYQGKKYKLNEKDCFSFAIDLLESFGADVNMKKLEGNTNFDKFNNIKSACV